MPISKEQGQELLRMTDQKLKKMFDDKKQTPKLLIPKNFPSFIKTQAYSGFINSVYEYCVEFNELLKQYDELKQKMSGRVGGETSLLRTQKQQLAKLEREVSYNYAAIIIQFNTQCLQEEKHRSNYKDQVFFESMIYLIERVMKEYFSRQRFLIVQEEINRLFRTNRYNLIKKRHENDEILHKYPGLKELKNKNQNNLTSILSRAPERINAFKKYEKDKRNNSMHDYTETLGLLKQLQNPDMEQRSPLICTWLPSRKSMLGDFSQISSYNNFLKSGDQRHTHQTIATSTSGDPNRSRMASLGNNVVNSSY